MGLFAFRRLRDREALATAGASFSMTEPEPKLEVTQDQPLSTDGNNNRRNGGRRKRQQLPDAGSGGTGN